MAIKFSLLLLAIISSAPLALASYSYPAFTAGVLYLGLGWDAICFSGAATCFDGCAANVAFGTSPTPQGFTYTFASESTSWAWWGYKSSGAGLAEICFDGATGSDCETVSYFDSNAQIGGDPAVQLFSKTGLTNGIHTVTVTNAADPTNGNQFGTLSVDHMVIDGTVPQFPSDTFISELPITAQPSSGQIYNVDVKFGSGTDPLFVLLDAGAGNGYAFWIGCTDALCEGHNEYVPSPALVNLTVTDELCFGSGGDCIQGWRVNDTLTFGTVSTQATWDALFTTTAPQPADGNLGVAKGYWYGSQCTSFHLFPGFVEQAFAHGDIKAPVVSLYYVDDSDNPAAGVSSVAQLGGVDTNKFTGEIDWVPMNAGFAWQSPSQTRTVRATTNGSPIDVQFTTPIIEFDTGDPGLLSFPDPDFQALAAALGAIEDSGQFFFPCESTVTLNMHGSQNREYVIPLGDPSQPFSGQAGFCATKINNSGSDTVLLMGVQVFTTMYMILHHQANFIGFATKNVGASAATVSVLTGSG